MQVISGNARYWTCTIWDEMLIDDWKEQIDYILQIPYCYIHHDKDKNDGDKEKRKPHYHFLIAFSNTTSYKHALETFQLLTKDCNPVKYIERVNNIRWIYDYFIHDTDDARKKGKHLYSPSERITGNSFDIGAFEQLGVNDKELIITELEDFIINNMITDYMHGLVEIRKHFEDSNYKIIYRQHGSHFEKLCKGNYLDMRLQFEHNIKRASGLVSQKYKERSFSGDTPEKQVTGDGK